MDIADRYGVALRLLLLSADRFSDSAMQCGLLCLKTLDSRSSALLRRVTSLDQRRPFVRDFISSSPLEKLDFALVAFCSRECRKRSKISTLLRLGIHLARIEAITAGFQFLNHTILLPKRINWPASTLADFLTITFRTGRLR
jgi:hypothetical protein